MDQGPRMVQEPGAARVWDGVGIWECEGTTRQGSGRGQEHGKGRSLGSYILTHGMGKEPGRVQEPGRHSDLRGVKSENNPKKSKILKIDEI